MKLFSLAFTERSPRRPASGRWLPSVNLFFHSLESLSLSLSLSFVRALYFSPDFFFFSFDFASWSYAAYTLQRCSLLSPWKKKDEGEKNCKVRLCKIRSSRLIYFLEKIHFIYRGQACCDRFYKVYFKLLAISFFFFRALNFFLKYHGLNNKFLINETWCIDWQ